jgi:hypothetical protein
MSGGCRHDRRPQPVGERFRPIRIAPFSRASSLRPSKAKAVIYLALNKGAGRRTPVTGRWLRCRTGAAEYEALGVEGGRASVPEIDFMRLPDVVLCAVAYLGTRIMPGVADSPLEYAGSGFVVSVLHKGTTFYYLVTADHVKKKLMRQVEPIIRMNDIHGRPFETEIRDVQLPKAPARRRKTPDNIWQRHTDKSVDLAVLSFTPWAHNEPPLPNGLPDMRPIAHAPDYLLVEDRQFGLDGIGIGDEVYVAGLFPFATGERANSPILRTGNLAMIPHAGDRIYTGENYGDMEAYLIEARSISGISGGPVFVRETIALKRAKGPKGPYDRFDQRKPQAHASGKFYVLGVAQGHWDIPARQLNNPKPTRAKSKQGVNIGVAIVTPARKLRDILYGDHFTKQREDHVALSNRR